MGKTQRDGCRLKSSQDVQDYRGSGDTLTLIADPHKVFLGMSLGTSLPNNSRKILCIYFPHGREVYNYFKT